MQLPRLTAAIGVAGLLALAACGGGSDTGGGSGEDFRAGGGAGSILNADAEAPAPPIDGAQKGGTIDVWGTSGLQSMHPTEAYFTNTTSILSNLVTRSLTQYRWSEEKQAMELVPDLATDLGRPNDDFTKWTFTIRDGIKWQDGRDVTMDDVVRGIEASFDNHADGAFPNGAEYSKTYFKGGDWAGPYTDPSGGCGCVTVDGRDITIQMSRPFPDMPYWGSFPAMGPLPKEAEGDVASYGLSPWSTGPLQVPVLRPGHVPPDPGAQRILGPEHRPGPARLPRRVGLRRRPWRPHRAGPDPAGRPGRSPDRDVVRQHPAGQPLGRRVVGPTGDRTVAVHHLLVHGHPQARVAGHRGPQGARHRLAVRRLPTGDRARHGPERFPPP